MVGRFFRTSIAACALALAACTHSDLRPDYVRQPSTSLAPQPDAPLVVEAKRLEAEHPGESGLRLLANSIDALISRIALADRAKYSIDLQYYIYHGDATGKLLAQHLIMAADRGVRVRVLLDDLHEVGHDPVLRALDAHPHIEIRLFNPFHERSGGAWGMGKQFAGDFSRLNRRMHNKAFIVDGAGAVVGGRNIGDEYFDASGDVNFRDLDVLLIGPVVAEVANVFDQYWNSDPSVPIEASSSARRPRTSMRCASRSKENAAAMRDSPFGKGARAGTRRRSREARDRRLGVGAEATFLADDPGKVTPDVDDAELHLAPKVREWLDTAQQRVLLISPYFIPRDKGVAYLAKMRERGVEIEVLTNSLSSTDADGVYRRVRVVRAAAARGRGPDLRAEAERGTHAQAEAPDHRDRERRKPAREGDRRRQRQIVHRLDESRSALAHAQYRGRRHRDLARDRRAARADIRAGDRSSVTYEVKLKAGSKSTVYWETKENGETVLYDDAPRTSGSAPLQGRVLARAARGGFALAGASENRTRERTLRECAQLRGIRLSTT